MPELIETFIRILHGEAGSARPQVVAEVRVPAQLPPANPGFLGRAMQLPD
jgi:hypothetical protein